MAPNTAEYCKYFAEQCREAAKQMRAMSAAHEEMAKGTRQLVGGIRRSRRIRVCGQRIPIAVIIVRG